MIKCLTIAVFDVHSGLCLQQQRQEVSGASESRMMKSWKTEEQRNSPVNYTKISCKISYLDL